jgi:outer membrane receptor protein involved in Fe transport
MIILIRTRSRTFRLWVAAALTAMLAVGSGTALAQDAENDEPLEEITVTGTQIKGAKISDALAVSVFSSEDIEILGVESGEELFDSIPEMGQNFFNESDTAGSVNAARGDVGAINLRNLGTGNTLTLLNGRRLVNMATYQTEEVGGSFVPVNSVNSRHIPVFGLERVEILRDGASAIYGADAVAGVVNTVLKDDYEGFTVRLRYSEYDHIPRNDESLAIEWGDSFNGGATHVGVFARHYRRDRINTQDESRWANSDFRGRFPDGSPYALGGIDGIEDDDDDESFNNTSGNSLYGRFDVVPNIPNSHSLNTQNIVQPGAEDFELFPSDHPDCAGTFFILPSGVCMREDSANRGFRHNLNGGRDLMSELERTMVYGYINHEVNESLEAFGEAYFYDSSTNKVNSAVTDLGSVVLRVGASNYYNPLGAAILPDGTSNRLPDPDGLIYEDVPDEGYDLFHDLYRFEEAPRTVDNDGQSTRLLFGLRGTKGDWDWESAVVWSEATRDDFTRNRISNTLITQAFYDPTPAAYNGFSGGVDSNIERAVVGMYRKGRSTLSMWDLKFSNPEIFEMPAGPVGFLAGYEYRRETYEDDRDPRLDGTIRFMRESDPINAPGVFDIEGDFDSCDPETTELGCSDTGFDTYPLTSDIVGASPTPDGRGNRTTNSLFVEFQVPLHRTLDLQLAARYEDFDDIGDTTVGKIAFGWRPIDQLLFRGSWSEAFRAPNLITINEQFVARANVQEDWLCQYAETQTTADDTSFCSDSYSMQRQATGSKDLVPEESTNTSIGVVITPVEGLGP